MRRISEHARSLVLIIGLLLNLGLFLYPPWKSTLDIAGHAGASLHFEQFGGYGWFWDPPDRYWFLVPRDYIGHRLADFEAFPIKVKGRNTPVYYLKLEASGSRIDFIWLILQLFSLWVIVVATIMSIERHNVHPPAP